MTTPAIHPRLVVDDAAAAIDFYSAAFGAVELMRFADPSGKIVQAEVQIGDDVVALTESDGDCNLSPHTIGGSPLLLTLTVDDADAIGDAMVEGGAEVVIPIDDRFYGRREGRLRDVAGHLWIISQHLEELADEEITRRMETA